MDLNRRKIEIFQAESGLSKTELADRCNISRQHISTILRRGSCDPVTAGKLARGLGVPVSEIAAE